MNSNRQQSGHKVLSKKFQIKYVVTFYHDSFFLHTSTSPPVDIGDKFIGGEGSGDPTAADGLEYIDVDELCMQNDSYSILFKILLNARMYL